jgi:hypothetical protein
MNVGETFEDRLRGSEGGYFIQMYDVSGPEGRT